MRAFLRSDGAVLLALALALGAQVPHAASVFARLATDGGRLGMLHAAVYALALELAVLLFVMRGKRRTSVAFAFVSVLVNLAYYFPGYEIAAAVLVSVALPGAIALYSHETAHADAPAVAHDARKGAPDAPRVRAVARKAAPRALASASTSARCEVAGCEDAPKACGSCGGMRCARHAGTHSRFRCAHSGAAVAAASL